MSADGGDRGRPLRLGGCCALVMLAVLAGAAVPASALAHPFELTNIEMRLGAGTYRMDITFHVDAMLADVPLGDLSADQYQRLRALPESEIERRLEMARQYFSVMVGVRFDGQTVASRVTFPVRESHRDGDRPALPGHLVRLDGAIPEGARAFTLTAAPVFNMIALRIVGPRGEPVDQMLDPLRESEPYPLNAQPPVRGRADVVLEYLRLGFLHIVPRGLDHMLFVLGLYLLSVRLGALLWQVTAFTVAHTLTLGLSTFGVLRLAPTVVEPLIALSIAYVAVENLFTSELKPWRPAIVFAFGLLHGLGFAGVLAGLGLPRERFVSALIGFNSGVEVGQLTVIAAAFAVVGWWRSDPRYRTRVVIPASAAIAVVGCYWAVVRSMASL